MWELHLGCCVGALECRLITKLGGSSYMGNLVPWPWGWVLGGIWWMGWGMMECDAVWCV